MKRAFIVGLLVLIAVVCAQTPTPPPSEFDLKLARFHSHYNLFIREYLGCDKRAASIDQCNPAVATFDWSEFNYARKAAVPLFDLERKKE